MSVCVKNTSENVNLYREFIGFGESIYVGRRLLTTVKSLSWKIKHIVKCRQRGKDVGCRHGSLTSWME